MEEFACMFHVQVQHKAVQLELEKARAKAAELAVTADECAELKARLASARASAAAAKQAAQQEEFQLQAQVAIDIHRLHKLTILGCFHIHIRVHRSLDTLFNKEQTDWAHFAGGDKVKKSRACAL